jgi:uncharacterized membrane protein
MSDWKFITNHRLVLATIKKGEGKTTREIGVTERTAHHIIMDIEKKSYITIQKIGNKNSYNICKEM